VTECDYCGAELDDEDAYLDHLAAKHEGELGRIDRRRVEDRTGGGSAALSPPVVIAGVLGVAVVGVLAAVFLFSGGGGNPGGGSGGAFADSVTQPTGVGTVHYHGTMTVTIDGQELDFSQSRYQLQADAFHYEGGSGARWHGHANRVTLEYALETLGIGVTNGKLSFDGTTYNRSDGDTVTYRVNGQQVDPENYVLQEGDSVTVVAESG